MSSDRDGTTGLAHRAKRLRRMGRVAGPTADCCEESHGDQPQQQMTTHLCRHGRWPSSNREQAVGSHSRSTSVGDVSTVVRGLGYSARGPPKLP